MAELVSNSPSAFARSLGINSPSSSTAATSLPVFAVSVASEGVTGVMLAVLSAMIPVSDSSSISLLSASAILSVATDSCRATGEVVSTTGLAGPELPKNIDNPQAIKPTAAAPIATSGQPSAVRNPLPPTAAPPA